MKKYIRGFDDNHMANEVFCGDDIQWAKEHEFTEEDVEKGYDGNWYEIGYAPKEIPLAIQERRIRDERDIRLVNDCDMITMLRFNAMDEDQKQEWITYRQALLDIPQQEGFPWGGDTTVAPWPQKPSLP